MTQTTRPLYVANTIPLYESDPALLGDRGYKLTQIIGEAEYNINFEDEEDLPRSLGYSQTVNGLYYLIKTSQWRKEIDHAFIVAPERIIQEAIRHDCLGVIQHDVILWSLYETKFAQNGIAKSQVFSLRIKLTDDLQAVQQKIDEMRTKITTYLNVGLKNLEAE
jgi:hypothetical protein